MSYTFPNSQDLSLERKLVLTQWCKPVGEDKGYASGDTCHIAPSSGSPRTSEIGKAIEEGVRTKEKRKAFALKDVHDGLSRVTEARKRCMPLDGTLDIWVLFFFMGLSLFSAAVGLRRLIYRNALISWDDGRESLIWLGIAFALVDATPGLLFMGCGFLVHMLLVQSLLAHFSGALLGLSAGQSLCLSLVL
jgi:hypothetical protein